MADLLVVGGGMAGLAAAGAATSAGAQLTLVEKRGMVGGSAAMSAGIVWTAADFKTLRHVVPGGDAALGQALIDGFWPGVDWVRATGVSVSERWEGQMGFGSAVRVDIKALLAAWQRQVESAGGVVMVRSAARRLLTDESGRVRGAAASTPAGAPAGPARAPLVAPGRLPGRPEAFAPFFAAPGRPLCVPPPPGA